MVYILWGEDDYSLTRTLEEIKRQSGDPATLAVSTSTLDGKQVTPEELSTVLQTVPFLMGKRLVIVEGLLERFEQPTQSRRRTSPRQKTDQTNSSLQQAPDKHKPFSAATEHVPESTILVLIDGKVSTSNPLFKELASKATVKTFPLLKEPKLREWVQTRVAAEGGNIAPRAVTLLVRLVGSNLWIMASEIDKLILFTRGRRIEEEDIKLMVSYSEETKIYTMVDAVLESRSEAAEQALEQLLQSGAAPVYLLTMLARQVQLIVRAKELKRQKRNNSEIQETLRLSQEFLVRKTLEQANRYSLPRLREVYHQILETDLAIKTGQYDAELALTLLVGELSRRGKTWVGQGGV